MSNTAHTLCTTQLFQTPMDNALASATIDELNFAIAFLEGQPGRSHRNRIARIRGELARRLAKASAINK